MMTRNPWGILMDLIIYIYIVVKKGLFNPHYNKIPWENGYRNGKILLSITEQDTKSQFKRKYPGYFKDISA